MYEKTERFYSSFSISCRKISFFTKSNRLKILFENNTENFEADICSLQKKTIFNWTIFDGYFEKQALGC